MLLGNQVSSGGHRVTTVTLIPGSTKELVHKGRGSPRPPHKDRPRRSTPSRKVVDVAGELQSSKGPAHQALLVGSTKDHSTKAQSLALTHSRANLALTLFKSSAKPKDMINMHLDGLEMFLLCLRLVATPATLKCPGDSIYIALQVHRAVTSRWGFSAQCTS